MHTPLAAAVVGLEKADYTVSESGRVVQVCAVVVSESSSCVITFPFSIIISTGDISGMYITRQSCLVVTLLSILNHILSYFWRGLP